ncbi:MAG: TPM domain-containing protein [Veillonellaceae bacterium]|nr:TPM domain-containing protein [Veillonellaceae bacterium]
MLIIKRSITLIAFLTILLFSSIGLAGSPSYIQDESNILTSEQKDMIEKQLIQLRNEANCDMQVVLLDSLHGNDIHEYSIKLAEKNKIGQEGTDRGLILLIVADEHMARLEVGRGLEGDIPDATAGDIIDDVSNALSKDSSNYIGAIQAAIDKVSKTCKTGISETKNKPVTSFWSELSWAERLIIIIMAVIMIYIIYIGSWFAYAKISCKYTKKEILQKKKQLDFILDILQLIAEIGFMIFSKKDSSSKNHHHPRTGGKFDGGGANGKW